jgi:hypothetical protein
MLWWCIPALHSHKTDLANSLLDFFTAQIHTGRLPAGHLIKGI